jgi:hypothetical protein
MQEAILQRPRMDELRTQPAAHSGDLGETFMGRLIHRSPPVNRDDHHWDIMAEFIGLYDPGLVRHSIAITAPLGMPARLRARVATRRAWADLIYEDTTPQGRANWLDSMPPEFEMLTDDYALAALMMWTYADLRTARVFKIYAPDPGAQIFDSRWLQLHFPTQRILMISATEKSWLCPNICMTCTVARLSCPECRAAARHWPVPASGSGLEMYSNIKDHPPCGSGHYLPPCAREEIWEDWMLAFQAFADAHLAATDSQASAS